MKEIFLGMGLLLAAFPAFSVPVKLKNQVVETYLKDPYVNKITLNKKHKIKDHYQVRHYQTPQLAEICLLEAQDLTEHSVVIDLPRNVSRFDRLWAMPGTLEGHAGLYIMKFDLSFIPASQIEAGIFGVGLTTLKDLAKETFNVDDRGDFLEIEHRPYYYNKFQQPKTVVKVNDRWRFSRQYLLSLYTLLEEQVEKLHTIDRIKGQKDQAFWRDMVHRHIAFCTSPQLGPVETDPVVQKLYQPLKKYFKGDSALRDPQKLKAFIESKKRILKKRSNSIQTLRHSLKKKRQVWEAYRDQMGAIQSL